MCCGFGAVVLLVMLLHGEMLTTRKEVVADLQSEVVRMEREVKVGRENLVEIKNSLQQAEEEIVRTEGLSRQVLQRVDQIEDELASLEGKSLAPAIQESGATRDTLYFAYRGVQRAVRDGRFKLIEYVVEGQRHTQLYDLHADPWEINDLSEDARYAEQLENLRGELRCWRDELDDSQSEQGELFWEGYAE